MKVTLAHAKQNQDKAGTRAYAWGISIEPSADNNANRKRNRNFGHTWYDPREQVRQVPCKRAGKLRFKLRTNTHFIYLASTRRGLSQWRPSWTMWSCSPLRVISIPRPLYITAMWPKIGIGPISYFVTTSDQHSERDWLPKGQTKKQENFKIATRSSLATHEISNPGAIRPLMSSTDNMGGPLLTWQEIHLS